MEAYPLLPRSKDRGVFCIFLKITCIMCETPHFCIDPVMAQDTYIDEMTIYNPSGKAIYDAPVTTSAIIKYALMGGLLHRTPL